MNDLSRLKPGDQVVIRSINERRHRGPNTAIVMKMGRKLVHVEEQFGHMSTFRIEDGQRNDAYGHEWIETSEEAAENGTRRVLLRELRDGGVEIRLWADRFTTDQLRAIRQIVYPEPREEQE